MVLLRFLVIALLAYMAFSWLRTQGQKVIGNVRDPGAGTDPRGGRPGPDPSTPASAARCPFCGHAWSAGPAPAVCPGCGTVFREGEFRA